MTLADLLLILALIVVVVVLGYILIPYFKKKGVLNDQITNTMNQLLEFASVVVNNLKTSEDVKDKATTIFEITQKVVQYVEQTMEDSSSNSKKFNAVDITTAILESIGIEINDDTQRLIEVGIESAVNAMNQIKKQ